MDRPRDSRPDTRAIAEVDLKLAYLGNFTLDLLPRYVDVHGAREGIRIGSYIGKFDQYVQEILDDESDLVRFQPDVIFLALSLRLLEPERIAALSSMPAEERRNFREEVVSHLESWAGRAIEKLPATLLIANFPVPTYPLAGVADVKSEYSETELYLELNLELLRRFKGNPRVRLFDLDRLASRYGKDRVLDPKMFYLAKMEWSAGFLPTVADEVVRQVKAVRGLGRKCLVLDLDNTLWGGVVGEDGAAGIKIGTGDPEAEAFLDFQHRLKALQDRGVLLAVCSKNNPADVLEVFESRPEIPLKLADFAATEIGWSPKHLGLKKIAAALGIGTDSLVFMDDNPAEISLVQQMMPEVKTVLLPPDPAEYAGLIERLNDFEKPEILEEDRRKADQYRENRQRLELQSSASDLRSYLASLRTEVEVHLARREDLPRVHQLFTKTNQFNLTTERYSQAEVERFATSPACELWVARARDRFGDLGMIAAVLLKKVGRMATIDSFLMSCRAMGRGIETAIMNHIKQRLLEDRSGLELRGRYIPTPKNEPVETFYDEQGFRLLESSSAGEKLYGLRRDEARPVPCDWIRVTQDELVGSR
ncbi:MAG TPA: HAD-IIIC family phosphatase [Thermoanaerobaculia bacterium]|nr:HAD-IIIC family phosphatase [Thermoanaerobaculia bacterium]